jgi:hypothetical protein
MVPNDLEAVVEKCDTQPGSWSRRFFYMIDIFSFSFGNASGKTVSSHHNLILYLSVVVLY